MNVCVTVTEFVLFHIPSTAPYDLGRRASNLGEDAVWSQPSSPLSPSFFLLTLGPLGAGRGVYSFTAITINIQLIQEVGRTRLDAVKSSAYSKQQS